MINSHGKHEREKKKSFSVVYCLLYDRLSKVFLQKIARTDYRSVTSQIPSVTTNTIDPRRRLQLYSHREHETPGKIGVGLRSIYWGYNISNCLVAWWGAPKTYLSVEVEAVDGLRAEASDGGVRPGGVQVSSAPVGTGQFGEVEVLAAGHRAVGDTDGEEVDVGGVLDSVLDVVEPSSTTVAGAGFEHTDTDVGELTLLDVGRGGERQLGAGPVGCIGISCELEATDNRCGIAGDRPENVDTALFADLDGVALDGEVDRNKIIADGDGSTENAGGENSSVDKDLGKHFEGGSRLVGRLNGAGSCRLLCRYGSLEL